MIFTITRQQLVTFSDSSLHLFALKMQESLFINLADDSIPLAEIEAEIRKALKLYGIEYEEDMERYLMVRFEFPHLFEEQKIGTELQQVLRSPVKSVAAKLDEILNIAICNG